MKDRNCIVCLTKLSKRHQIKFCSNQCQAEHQYNMYISLWKKGILDGNRGIKVKNLSNHIRKYLINKFGEKCSQCSWKKRHPATGNVPLEVDHIDGNANNNLENNLSLLCPNCHSLTPNFRNLNIGKGRKWRVKKI